VPIVVELLDGQGRVVRGLPDPAGGTFDAAGEFDDLLPLVGPQRFDAGYRVLGAVDPDGLLTVGAGDMDDLLLDIAAATELTSEPRARRGLERLRVLAERCRDDPRTQVRFAGD